MSRWTSLLALVLCAFVGGAVEALADVPAAVETHESAPAPAELPASESEAEEEEVDRPAYGGLALTDGAVVSGSRPAGAESPADTPTPPPPRR